jgi:Fe-S oxidoreductase
MGGPHVSFLADEALSHADFIIRGEGEKALLKLIENIERESNDFSSIPDFTLVEGYNFNKLKIYPISTSRGCPYNCTFCAVVPIFGRKYRFRNEDLVIEEIKNLKKVEHIFFYDDNFAADKERAKILLEKMIKNKF